MLNATCRIHTDTARAPIGVRPVCIGVRPVCIGVRPVRIGVHPVCIGVRPVHIGVRPVHIAATPGAHRCLPVVYERSAGVIDSIRVRIHL